MPEGPEVENMRRRIAPLGGQRVSIRVTRDGNKFITAEQAKPYQNQKVTEVQRVGKRIGILFEDQSVITVGAGMSGNWHQQDINAGPLPHEMFSLSAPDIGKRFTFTDVRCYGFVKPGDSTWKKNLGIDFMDPQLAEDGIGETLKKRYRARRKDLEIKVALLDQSVIAGIGNVYASELLWHLKVHPETKVSAFSEFEQLGKLTHWMLNLALNGKGVRSSHTPVRYKRRGSAPHGYTMEAYGLTGNACSRCGTSIEQSVLGGRSTFWCPTCQ